jgi:hypothetical protein
MQIQVFILEHCTSPQFESTSWWIFPIKRMAEHSSDYIIYIVGFNGYPIGAVSDHEDSWRSTFHLSVCKSDSMQFTHRRLVRMLHTFIIAVKFHHHHHHNKREPTESNTPVTCCVGPQLYINLRKGKHRCPWFNGQRNYLHGRASILGKLTVAQMGTNFSDFYTKNPSKPEALCNIWHVEGLLPLTNLQAEGPSLFADVMTISSIRNMSTHPVFVRGWWTLCLKGNICGLRCNMTGCGKKKSRDSSVDIATRLRAGWPRN